METVQKREYEPSWVNKGEKRRSKVPLRYKIRQKYLTIYFVGLEC